jgi:hypothetical protein
MKNKEQVLQEIANNIKKLQLEKKFLSNFEEVYLMVGKFNTSFYSSPEVNKTVNEVIFTRGGSTYSDSLVFASFYIEKGTFKVYSYPHSFYIGSSINGVFNAINPSEKYKAELLQAGIPEPLILKVEDFLSKNPPENAKFDYSFDGEEEDTFRDSKSYLDDEIF